MEQYSKKVIVVPGFQKIYNFMFQKYILKTYLHLSNNLKLLLQIYNLCLI